MKSAVQALRLRFCWGRRGMQTMLHQKGVMHSGNDGKDEGCAEKDFGRHIDQEDGFDEQEEDEENGSDLGESIGLAEDAGAKIAQAGDHEKHAADEQNRDVAAEHEDGVFPGNERALFDGENEKHGAHEELVGDGVKILAEQCLLMESAGEQAIEAIAESGEDEQDQSPLEIVLDQVDNDEGQEDHPQQRQLVGSG